MSANTPVRRLTSSAKKYRAEPLANPWVALTEAEFQVALELMEGLTNKEIAMKLGKRDATIKNQMRSMFRRTGYSNRARLIVALITHRVFAERMRTILDKPFESAALCVEAAMLANGRAPAPGLTVQRASSSGGA